MTLSETDNVKHILLRCSALEDIRTLKLSKVKGNMPPAMLASLQTCNDDEKILFYVSGFNCPYTPDWIDLYEATSKWVYAMYESRKLKYDLLIETA